MPIAIDTAGLHPASENCLEALQWLHERRGFDNILDIGCGNGILSVLAAGIWGAQALAVDISTKAVEDTRRNAASHGLEGLVTAIRSDGFSHPLIRSRAPYDLILFNLLAEPVIEMAPDVRSHLATDGVAIIGGLLAWKTESTQNVYRQLGFEIIKEIIKTPWHTCIARPHAPMEKSIL